MKDFEDFVAQHGQHHAGEKRSLSEWRQFFDIDRAMVEEVVTDVVEKLRDATRMVCNG